MHLYSATIVGQRSSSKSEKCESRNIITLFTCGECASLKSDLEKET
jgi:hypothetical protein